MKRKRVIGTTIEAIRAEETKLGRVLPVSFVDWLLENNGTDIEGVHIYPVKDDRDVRKTWESISHNYENGWAGWLENFEEEDLDFDHLLPFANFGTGDCYCFDYSDTSGEPAIARWSHETGKTEFRANGFIDFVDKVTEGEFDHD